MTKPEPKYRKQLNSEQYTILVLLAKFRFGTRALLGEYFAPSHPGMDVFRRLQVLEERGLISKRHEPYYRLLHKPAAYYLLPEGARTLQAYWDTREGGGKINVKTIYKDKTVSEQFIDHCLTIFATCNGLKRQYGDKGISFYTKSQIGGFGYDFFPDKLPDAYVYVPMKKRRNHFLLDVYHDSQPFFTAVRRVKSHAHYWETGRWVMLGKRPFPTILAVCDSPSLLKRLRRSMAKAMRASWGDELQFMLTTTEQLQGDNKQVWQKAREPREIIDLEDIW